MRPGREWQVKRGVRLGDTNKKSKGGETYVLFQFGNLVVGKVQVIDEVQEPALEAHIVRADLFAVHLPNHLVVDVGRRRGGEVRS